MTEIYSNINRVFSDATPFSPALGAPPSGASLPPPESSMGHHPLDQGPPTSFPFSTDEWLRLMNTPMPSDMNQDVADRLDSLPQSLRVSPEPKPKLPTPPATADGNSALNRTSHPPLHPPPLATYLGYIQQGSAESRSHRSGGGSAHAGSMSDNNPNTRRDLLSRRAELDRLRGLSLADWQTI